jgi:hypothetical protein
VLPCIYFRTNYKSCHYRISSDVENVNIVDRLNAEATPSQDYLRAREYIDKKKREKEERDLGIVKIGARVHVRDSESPIK